MKTATRDEREPTARTGIARLRGAAYVSTVLAVAIAIGLSACASVGHPSADRQPYVGAFTGDFVDGLPLYRLPSITVVGTRDDAGAD